MEVEIKIRKKVEEKPIEIFDEKIELRILMVRVDVEDKARAVFYYQYPVEIRKADIELYNQFVAKSAIFNEHYHGILRLVPKEPAPSWKELRAAAPYGIMAVFQALNEFIAELSSNWWLDGPSPYRLVRRLIMKLARYLDIDSDSNVEIVKRYVKPYVLYVSRNNIVINPLVDIVLGPTGELVEYAWEKCDGLPLMRYYDCVHRTVERIVEPLISHLL